MGSVGLGRVSTRGNHLPNPKSSNRPPQFTFSTFFHHSNHLLTSPFNSHSCHRPLRLQILLLPPLTCHHLQYRHLRLRRQHNQSPATFFLPFTIFPLPPPSSSSSHSATPAINHLTTNHLLLPQLQPSTQLTGAVLQMGATQ